MAPCTVQKSPVPSSATTNEWLADDGAAVFVVNLQAVEPLSPAKPGNTAASTVT